MISQINSFSTVLELWITLYICLNSCSELFQVKVTKRDQGHQVFNRKFFAQDHNPSFKFEVME
jgi:hypothetical protein